MANKKSKLGVVKEVVEERVVGVVKMQIPSIRIKKEKDGKS